MAVKDFTNEEEIEGKVLEYIEENPVYYRQNWPDKVVILTGEDMPDVDNG